MQTAHVQHALAAEDGDRSDPAFDAEYYLHERYLAGGGRSPLLAPYYRLKPALPRSVQLALRRRYARHQAKRPFPAWPIESVLIDHRDAELKRRLRDEAADRVPFVGFWPDGYTSACILTHDVEGPEGIKQIERVLEVEQRHGFVSSWNFVAEWYPIPDHTFDRLRAAGCEIGLHGIKHDGMLFASRAQFDANLARIHSYLAQWGAVGFRSPATHRNADWMPELGCLYDSSFPDTDPFEPQAGGCCSIFPFMLGEVVELPITLTQDHTLMEILRHRTIDLWRTKCEWIVEHSGLINVITHPDYLIDPGKLAMYEQLLEYLAKQHRCWHALPRDVADWWRNREGLLCEATPTGARIAGDPTGRAVVAWASEIEGGVRITCDSDSLA